jgi:TonB family protein
MQIPLRAFDVAAPHPLRQMRRVQAPLRNRLGAVLITVAAHIVAIAALVDGLHQANIIRQPEVVAVHIDVVKKKPELVLPLPAPQLAKPSVITAPVPLIDIAPPPDSTAPHAVLAAPVTPPPSPVSKAPASQAALTWQGQLLARLEQAKRYQPMAQARRQQGVVLLHFTMDREGRVLTADIPKSSGFPLLDQEALALIRRAQPLPEPPAEVGGNSIELSVPIEFFLSNRR